MVAERRNSSLKTLGLTPWRGRARNVCLSLRVNSGIHSCLNVDMICGNTEQLKRRYDLWEHRAVGTQCDVWEHRELLNKFLYTICGNIELLEHGYDLWEHRAVGFTQNESVGTQSCWNTDAMCGNTELLEHGYDPDRLRFYSVVG